MKRLLGIMTAACIAVTLAACSSSNSASSKSNSSTVKSSKVEKKKSSASSKKTAVLPTKLNQRIAADLAKKFNDDGEKNVKTEVKANVADEQSATDKNGSAIGHQIIEVTIINAKDLKVMKAAKKALDSNTADKTQTQSIAAIQGIVADEAKKLANDHDSISMGWPLEDADHVQLIALATRKENVIAIAGQN